MGQRVLSMTEFGGPDSLVQLVEKGVVATWEGVGACVGAAGNTGNTPELMPSRATR